MTTLETNKHDNHINKVIYLHNSHVQHTSITNNPPLIEDFVDIISSGVSNKFQMSYVYISLCTFFEHFTTSQIIFFNRTLLGFMPTQILMFLNTCYSLTLKLYKRTGKKFSLYSFMYLVSTAFFIKDLTVLKHFFEEKFKNKAFKKHRRILSMLRYVFKLISSIMIRQGIISGFKMLLAGKIGAAGSTKKKIWAYKIGRTNQSTKFYRLKHTVSNLWTRTGCLGLKLYLSY